MIDEELRTSREMLKTLREGAGCSIGAVEAANLIEALLDEIDRLKSLSHDPEEWPMASPEQEALAAEAADELRRQELEEEWETTDMRVVEWNKEQTEYLRKKLGWGE